MQSANRKSTPRVVDGLVRKKNNWKLSPDYYQAPDRRSVMIDRKRPGAGYRHVLNKSDIYRFLEILPDWDKLAIGLNAVVLAPGEDDTDGYHIPGAVHICAWESELLREHSRSHYEAHRRVFERLNVECKETEDGWYLCLFTEPSIRAYQLLHILLHELGHHHDRMTTRRQKSASRGEKYAEDYALQHEAMIWRAYQSAFAF